MFGRTKVVSPRAGASGSRAACRCDSQGSSAVAPPPARAFVEDDPIIDDEEEALERVDRTIAVLVQQSPYHGP